MGRPPTVVVTKSPAPRELALVGEEAPRRGEDPGLLELEQVGVGVEPPVHAIGPDQAADVGGEIVGVGHSRKLGLRRPAASAGTSEDLGPAPQLGPDELVDLVAGDELVLAVALLDERERRAHDDAAPPSAQASTVPTVRTQVDAGCWPHAAGSACQRDPLGEPAAVVEVQGLVGRRVGHARRAGPRRRRRR